MDDFPCTRCGQKHPYGELGFNWPDAAFALSLTDAERQAAQYSEDGTGKNEDVAIVKDAAFFVRGVLPIPVHGRAIPYRLGFWIRISPKDFYDFERRRRVEHPAYPGHLANQCDLLGPTLGLAARMNFVGAGQRPELTLTDGRSPLAKSQAEGVEARTVYEWQSNEFHAGATAPPTAPTVAVLSRDGFEVLGAAEAGRDPARLRARPQSGDNVKVIVQFLASDEKGDAVALLAGWWVTLDDASRPDRWSGTLASIPRVPSTLSLGSRVWVRPSDVIEYDSRPSQPEGGA